MRWYGDNSELNGIWDAPIPDILLFGGVAVTYEAAVAIQNEIQKIKEFYDPSFPFPIKWNGLMSFANPRKIYLRRVA
jgi:hypothetical protein